MSMLIISCFVSDTLGFLISDVSRLMRRRFDERARLIGVTRPQWRALTTLSRHEGANQGTLADLLEVEPITLGRMLDRLAEAGLIERRPDPQDRRAWRIFLTDKAHPLIEDLRALAAEMFGQALDGIDDADRAHLSTTLDRIRDNLISIEDTRKAAAHG